MPTNVIMPQLGESVVEGTVSKWLKKEGDRVNEFEPLMEVNTDKVDTEVPSPASGVLLKLYVPEGTTVKAGTLLAVIGQPGEATPEGGITTDHASHAPTRPAPAPAGIIHLPGAVASASAAPTPAASTKRDLGFISPVVAKIADEHKVDLQLVSGTGQGGRITKKDVLDYIEKMKSAPLPATAPKADVPAWEQMGDGDLFRPTELQFGTKPLAVSAQPSAPTQPPASPADEAFIPVVGMRKVIAEHMVRSERTSPHVTTVFEADLSKVLAHLEAHKEQYARDGVTLTLTAYFVSATVAALKAVPIVNSQWAEDGASNARIILKREVNIGLAVALDEGLIVPVIKNADNKSLLGIAREVNDLARRARAKALRPDEVQGGTFTITNHGVSGSLFATPIINQPQTGILGVGIMQKRAVVINDAIAIRPMVYLTLTFDHRLLDGAVADRFLATMKTTLENWS